MTKITMLAAFVLAALIPASALAQDQDTDLSQAYAALSRLGNGTGGAAPAVPVPAAIKQPAAPAATRAAAKKWTIMVYIDGKNSLESDIYTNIRQMEQLGSTDKVNVVVEIGRMNGQENDFHGEGDWTGCRRFLITRNNTAGKDMVSPMLQNIPNCDMGDYNHAIDFGKWAMNRYPAEHYMYVLWNHGGGWFKTTPGYTNAKTIAYDDQTRHVISTPQMASILKALGHIDVYGSDACLMQMSEVAYEIRNQADFIVGSEKTEPGNGWQYANFLKKMYGSGMSPLEVANAVVDTYTPQYPTGATLSTIRASAMDGLVARLNIFEGAVQKAGEMKTAAAAREKAQNFKVPNGRFVENKDLYDFLSLVSASSRDTAVKAAARDLMSYIDNTLVLDNKVSKDYSRAHGVAIYAPTTGYNRDYDELLFAFTKWPAMIKLMQR
jgi:hypothetical protein